MRPEYGCPGNFRDSLTTPIGVSGFDGSRGVQAISDCLAATPPTSLYEKNSHQIFTFRVDSTGQLWGGGGVRTCRCI